MKSKKSKGKVAIGLSGGVDSALSAWLLKQQDYDVHGVFIKVWEPPNFPCRWLIERREAMRVAAFLNIPFTTLDLSNEYKKQVIDYLIDEYKAGRTPNPDVMCNQTIKFGAFFDWAMNKGFQFVATGHYARLKEVEGQYHLLKAVDKDKDQTYFLWAIKPKVLSKVLFPIGDFKKTKVRSMARQVGLPNYSKKDSQGLCFVGPIDFKEFLKTMINEKPGVVLNNQNKIIGRHPGAFFFTLGERHGFYLDQKESNQGPMYVVSKDVDKNTINVDFKPPIHKIDQKIKLKDTNWMTGQRPEGQILAAGRYRQEPFNCEFLSDFEIKTKILTDALAPGQSMVFWQNQECLGGGVIDNMN